MSGVECLECERSVVARGLCGKHYQAWRKQAPDTAVGPALQGIPAIDRLLEQCVQDGDCWIYTGRLEGGYARVRGEDSRKEYGHRITWRYFMGEWPEGLTYDHLCRRKSCLNPWHGEPVPGAVNSWRAEKFLGRLNAEKTRCPQGHPLAGDNLVTSAPGRVCRTCSAANNRAYRARKKAAA